MQSSAASLLQDALQLHRQGALAEAAVRYRQILSDEPHNADALYYLATVCCQQGHLVEGAEFASRAVAQDPSARAYNLLGMALQRIGKLDDALASFDRAIVQDPRCYEAHGNRANVLSEVGRHHEAVESYDHAVSLSPDSVEDWCNRGTALLELGRLDEAVASYDRAVSLRPELAELHFCRAKALARARRYSEAVAGYDMAIERNPRLVDALNDRGVALIELDQAEQALAGFNSVLAVEPGHFGALVNRGRALRRLGRLAESLVCYDAALAAEPGHADALNGRGLVRGLLGRVTEAMTDFGAALARAPNHLGALNNYGNALLDMERVDEALACFNRLLAQEPDHVGALFNRGLALVRLGHYVEAAECYQKVSAMQPDHPQALGELLGCRVMTCNWSEIAQLAPKILARVGQRTSFVVPFYLFAIGSTPSQQLAGAQDWLRYQGLETVERLDACPPDHSGKIKIAYISADFREHAMPYLTAQLFEIHDREKFEVIGISIAPDDGSPMRVRLVKAFDQFHDVSGRSDRDIAELIRHLGVHIAIDLMGYTKNSRFGVLAFRPAPIQASYLGFPATTGADFIDYVIADEIVLPADQQPFWSEKIVHLPGCYLVNDSKKKIAARVPSRREVGLPDRGFVWCCFNGNYKITEPFFDSWMRLLNNVDGSVLWLLRTNDTAAQHLVSAAAARGVDPARLVFAPATRLDDHLARMGLADLFLDTLPVNAHTTASDALWVGLPVLTCCGDTFAGRVAASVLCAIGLSELVTTNLQEYEALALKLSNDPTLMQSTRRKLAENRLKYPLFDSDRFRHHMETAYVTMWDIWRRGEEPRSFSVEST